MQSGGGDRNVIARRDLLQSVGIAGLAGLSGGALAQESSQEGTEPLTVRGSDEQVLVTGAVPGATATLYGPDGSQEQDATADERGSVAFSDVEPGEGYTVTQTVDGSETSQSSAVRVLPVDYTPPQSLYTDQDLTDGFGYIETRDGTTLASQVVLPESKDPPYPALMIYSGYEPSVSLAGNDTLVNLIVESMGYALVGVNMRGSACSGGKFDFGEPVQGLDGYDAIEAVAAQDWADGVGMVGFSFPGFTQLYVAATQPPSLDAIVPGHVVGDFYRDTAYPGGMRNTTFAEQWAADRDAAFEAGGSAGNVDQRIANGDETCEANQELRGQNRDLAEQMRSNEFYTGLFRERSPKHLVDQIDVPTMFIVSWQDEQVGSRAAHIYEQFADDIPKRFIGLNGDHAEYFGFNVLNKITTFLTLYVKGEAPSDAAGSYEDSLANYEAEDPIQILWETNQNDSPRYTSSYSEWPPEQTDTWSLYFQPDGSLAEDPPETETDSASSYDYTVPSAEEQTIGRDDQGRLAWEQRSEEKTVSFLSAELDQHRSCLGSGAVELWLKSSASDTDIQVTLSEVRPDGQEQFVQTGWLRASHRVEDAEQSTLRRPYHTHDPDDQAMLGDEFEQMRVELLPFGHTFREGSRIKVAVEEPGGNRDRWAFDLVDEEATNEVAHTASMPSRIALPLVPTVSSLEESRPDCGEVRHQPCRPVRDGLLDDTGDGEMEDDGSDDDSEPGDADETDDEEDGADGDDQTADDDGAGLGLATALGGLGAGSYLVKRRFDAADPDHDASEPQH
jgi:predicted acyl esterase